MSYTTNPHMPEVRRDAVRLVCYRHWSMRRAARHFGVEPSTVSRWVKLDPTGGWRIIPTRSSRPHGYPRAIAPEIVARILALRQERKQCAEILHWRLGQEGVVVSLSSVKRILKRHRMSRFSRWKKWHAYPPRPIAEKPGILVEIDTVHVGRCGEQLYLYTLLDVCSRWAYARPSEVISTHRSLVFVDTAVRRASFRFHMLQSDHGPEFSKWFTKQIVSRDMIHRHSRVRTPNDNAHLERFNRTIQEECLDRLPKNLRIWRTEIPEYLAWYNERRPHMGLQMQTPIEVLRRY